MITPFTADGRVDYEALGRMIDYVIEGGADYIVALGTTAETPTLYIQERAVVAMFIANQIRHRVPLVIGVGGNSTSEVLDQLREFDLRGADAILSVTPYYNKPSQEGLYQHFKVVSEHSPLPIILYNIAGRTGVNMTSETTLRIARDFENAGGAGLITPDLIPDEAGEWIEASDRHGLDRIFLVSPDSSTERLETVARNARGFVYAAARMGVTGERATIDASPELLVERTRQAGAENVCVGIGVSTAEQGAKVGSYADGVIVGSALVHTLLADDNKTARDPKEGLKLLAAKSEELAEGIHNAR